MKLSYQCAKCQSEVKAIVMIDDTLPRVICIDIEPCKYCLQTELIKGVNLIKSRQEEFERSLADPI